MPWELPEILDPDLAREGWERLTTLLALRTTVAGIENQRLRISALETSWYMRNQLLRDTDWAGMAHSLEVRVPLVDVDLWRVVARLIHAGQAPGKADMADATAALPDAVRTRPKSGFSIPVREWLAAPGRQPRLPGFRGLRGWAHAIYSNHCPTRAPAC
jgi:asparagine synthase (glutamine-hydrolysing)